MGVSREPSLILKFGVYKNTEPVPSSFFSLGNMTYRLTKKMRLSLWEWGLWWALEATKSQNHKSQTWKCHYISLVRWPLSPSPSSWTMLENRVWAHRAVGKVMCSAANPRITPELNETEQVWKIQSYILSLELTPKPGKFSKAKSCIKAEHTTAQVRKSYLVKSPRIQVLKGSYFQKTLGGILNPVA